jgi:nitrogen regulatory protein P-II 1
MSGSTSPSTGSGAEPEGTIMKLVKAILKPERFEFVKKALEDKGFISMTVTDVRGRGAQKGISLEYRGGLMTVDMLPKIQIEIVVSGERCRCRDCHHLRSARTGKIGDGKIFVIPVEKSSGSAPGRRRCKEKIV